jgi:hypothetical protein
MNPMSSTRPLKDQRAASPEKFLLTQTSKPFTHAVNRPLLWDQYSIFPLEPTVIHAASLQRCHLAALPAFDRWQIDGSVG